MKRFAAIAFALALAGCAAERAPSNMVLEGTIPAPSQSAPPAIDYRLTTEYTMLGPQGAEAGTHVVTGDFTVSGPGVRWASVTTGPARRHGEPATSTQHLAFVEGFGYTREQLKSMGPDFFTGFPPGAHDERALVWDEIMFWTFADRVEQLRLNEPVAIEARPVDLAGAGTFNNRRIQLTLAGVGRRNGEDCLLIHYEALLNTFAISAGPVSVNGRSDYLGDICVAIRTRVVEYGTLFEEVAGTVGGAQPGSGSQPLHVMRVATLQRLR